MVRSVEFGSPGRISGEVSAAGRNRMRSGRKFELENDERPVPVEGYCSCLVGYNCKHTAAVRLPARYLPPDVNGPGKGTGRETISGEAGRSFDRWPEAAADRAAGPLAGAPARGREHLFYVIHSDAMRPTPHGVPGQATVEARGTLLRRRTGT